ncbi:spermidine resistance protein [Nowakowskiella sp. JEL0407]|nr:spermidine resistance protein [Nowakowskiella sp. JEL0407]
MNFNKHIYASKPEPDEPLTHTLSGFEGPEKLLELWFNPKTNEKESDLSLLIVPQKVWEEMLEIVKCKVLSSVSNKYLNSYLLSESSMFVYSNRLILKTCGTTTLLHAIPSIMEIIKKYVPEYTLSALFYSRKAFMFPEKQAWPHGKWGDEVAYMDSILPQSEYKTAGYVVGKINGDHWCLYMASPRALPATEQRIEDSEDEEDDVTLEILMTKLDKNVMSQFWREKGDTSNADGKSDVYEKTGISEIYPSATVDDYLFDPCGYSLNALIGPYYFTIHVTPEDDFSYASFETSVPVKKYYQNHLQSKADSVNYEVFEDVINKVVEKFQPDKFSVTLFTRNSVARKHGRDESGLLEGKIDGFTRRDKIVHMLGKWDLVFCHFDKLS